MNTAEFLKSPKFKSVVYLLAILLAAVVIFEAGVAVGYHRAAFSYHWNAGFMGDDRDPRAFFAVFQHGPDEPNPHGTIGQVVSVHLPELLVKGPNTPEQLVIVGPGTQVRRFRSDGTSTDIAAGQQVIVVGDPDDKGQIQASFVRILPPLPTTTPANAR